MILAIGHHLATTISDEAREATQVQDQIQGAVATVRPLEDTPQEQRADALAAIRAEFAIVELGYTFDGEALLAGEEPDLARLGLIPQPDGVDVSPEAQAWFTYWVGHEATAVVQEPDLSEGGSLVVAPWAAQAVDLDHLRDLLAQHTAPAWYAEYPGGSWVVGAQDSVRLGQWLTWFAAIGLTIMVLALWGGYATELLRAVRSLAVPQLLAPSPRFSGDVLAVRILAPIAVVIAIGAVLSCLLLLPFVLPSIRVDGLNLPFGVILGAVLLILASGMAAWGLSVRRVLLADARMWQANPEED